MKKLLLTFLLSALFLGSYAQFNLSTNTVIGQQLVTVGTQSTFTVNFDNLTTSNGGVTVRDCASWSGTATPYTINFQKCQTQKGLQVMSYVDATTTTDTRSNDFKCYRYGTNDNPGRIYSIDSLLSVMKKSAENGTATNGPSYPAACLFGSSSTNTAFGQYPGKFKRVEYGFQFNLEAKAVLTDLVFEIDTYNAGNTGKTASYELAVYKGTTISDANLIAPKIAGFYVTGSGKKSVNLAQDLGISVSMLSNKKICIFLRTLGTTNSEGIVDAIPHAVDANNLPLNTDPTIVFDNFSITYGTASWDIPVGAVTNAVFNHNNGEPVITESTDYTGGTAVPVYPATDYPIYIYLSGKDRLSFLDIFESNNGGGHMSAFSFAATGAVKKKAADGTYSIDVPYTYTASDGTTPMKISIPAPASGSTNDTLQIQLLANVPNLATRAVRLEITNGIRFWYNVSALGDVSTSVDKANNNGITAFSANNLLYVINATDNITLYNIAGQKVKSVSSSDAGKGIRLNSGIYIVKTGSTVQKVIVD